MAVDKLVDSAQLDSDLTSVANAIRAKSGGSSQLAFPTGFVSEIGNISTGGNSVIEFNSITLTSEMNSYNILQAMGAKLKYKNSLVIMFILCTSAATGGSNYTNNNYYLAHSNTTITSKNARAWLQQTSGRIAPSTMAGQFTADSYTWYSSSAASIGSDGSFTFRASSGGVVAPVGSVCITIEIPTSVSNGDLDLTLFGA